MLNWNAFLFYLHNAGSHAPIGGFFSGRLNCPQSVSASFLWSVQHSFFFLSRWTLFVVSSHRTEWWSPFPPLGKHLLWTPAQLSLQAGRSPLRWASDRAVEERGMGHAAQRAQAPSAWPFSQQPPYINSGFSFFLIMCVGLVSFSNDR